MRYLRAATDAFTASGAKCAARRFRARYICHAGAMGAGIFHNGKACKGGRTRKDSRLAPVLVVNYDGGVGFRALKTELWQSRRPAR